MCKIRFLVPTYESFCVLYDFLMIFIYAIILLTLTLKLILYKFARVTSMVLL